MSSPHRALITAAGVVLAAAGLIAAAPAQFASTKVSDVEVETVLMRLCDSAYSDGSVFTVSGPRIQWSRPGPAGAVEAAAAIRNMRRASGALHIAAAGDWIVGHDAARRLTARANCSNREVVTHRHAVAAERIAVSASGDVAMVVADDAAIIEPAASWSSVADRRLTGSTFRTANGAAIRAMHWAGRSLLLIADQGIVAAQALSAGKDVSLRLVAAPPSASPVHSAYVNGLSYVLTSEGCFDVFVGLDAVPRVPRVACMAGPAASARYVAMTDEDILLFDDEGIQWSGARPTVLKARLDGTVIDVVGQLQALALSPALPAAPLALGPEPRRRAQTGAVNEFGPAIDKAWWHNAETYERWTARLAEKGWTGFTTHRGWASATGIAFTWHDSSTFLVPDGRTLSAVARQITYSARYSDEQLAAILRSNAVLATSLEGRLFQQGFVPIGSLLPARESGPVAFVGYGTFDVSWKSSPHLMSAAAPLDISKCATPAPVESAFADAFTKGVRVLGTLDDAPGAAKPSTTRLRASGLALVECGATWPRLLVLSNTEISAQHAGWPLRVPEALVVGIEAGSRSNLSLEDALRHWLDDVFRHRRVDRVLVPSSLLEVYIAGDTATLSKPLSLGTIVLALAEERSGVRRGRAAPCTAEESKARRALQEKLLRLQPVHSARRVDQVIGIVEDQLNPHHSMFIKDGATVWVGLTSHNQFVRLTKPPNFVDPTTDWHGMHVASLVFSALDPKGVLADARLAWVNEGQPDISVLNTLSAGSSIANVSHDLPKVIWAPYQATAGRDWSNVLFVAAARNPNEDPARISNIPLEWRLPNVLGVGVFDDENETAPELLDLYRPTGVDVLAPGFGVPAPGEGQAVCLDGSSYATAYVSAVAALLQHEDAGGLSAPEIRARLMATADWNDDLEKEYGGVVRGGRLNAERALNLYDTTLETDGPAEPERLRFKRVRIENDLFRVTGQVPGSSARATHTLFWSQVMRLTRTSLVDPETGGPGASFFLVYAEDVSQPERAKAYRTLRNVKITDVPPPGGTPRSTLAVPVTACTLAASPDAPVSCTGMDVRTLVDYVSSGTKGVSKFQ